MDGIQCSVEKLGKASVGDIVKMRVASIENGNATLEPVKSEPEMEMEMEMEKPKPSAMKQMAQAFGPEEEED